MKANLKLDKKLSLHKMYLSLLQGKKHDGMEKILSYNDRDKCELLHVSDIT